LKKPLVGHPLYQRIVTNPPFIMPWYLGCALIVISPLLLLPAMVFLSAVYGLRWAMQIASHIAHEREFGMYELLALSPPGRLGINRTIISACLYRNESLEQVQAAGAWMMRGFFTLVFMLIGASLTGNFIPEDVTAPAGAVIILIYLFTMAAAVYVDHLQSIVLAVLVGMLIPTYTTRRIDAGAGAFIGYLTLQVVTYAITLIIGFVVAPRLLEFGQVAEAVRAVILPVARLAIFVVSREAVIWQLWRAVVRENNAMSSELETASAAV
jgi:hypothetical protein